MIGMAFQDESAWPIGLTRTYFYNEKAALHTGLAVICLNPHLSVFSS